MKITYTNWSTSIFEGFYESNLFNSDTEFYLNEMLQDEEHPQSYEIDFTSYCEDVANHATELLTDYCILYSNENIIKSMDYKGLSSPRFYNFSTDKLIIDIDFNLTKLKAYINKNKSDFNQYLKDNFTSCDGFISYIANNYNDFMLDYSEPWNKEKCINVMLEYYILRCIYSSNWNEIKELVYNDSDYHQALYEHVSDAQVLHAIEVTENQ